MTRHQHATIVCPRLFREADHWNHLLQGASTGLYIGLTIGLLVGFLVVTRRKSTKPPVNIDHGEV
jgi:hypothetical protein